MTFFGWPGRNPRPSPETVEAYSDLVDGLAAARDAADPAPEPDVQLEAGRVPGMPDGLKRVAWPPPGTTHCMRGEICGKKGGHPLASEHLHRAAPASIHASLRGGTA
jgi:hypothetical protein